MRWLAAVMLLLAPGTALPCGDTDLVEMPETMVADPPPRIVGHRVIREFRHLADRGPLASASSCAGVPGERDGEVRLRVELPGWQATGETRWEIDVVSGSDAPFVHPGGEAFAPVLLLVPGLDDDEPIDVEVVVTAIDEETGERSPPSAPYRIQDDAGMGCAAAGGGSPAAVLLVVALLLSRPGAAARRRA